MCATTALDAAHRASIDEKLRPLLGDEDANVLVSDLSSLEAQELVTKDFLSRARYEEPSDPALARWHDGTQLTEHTVVTADW